MTTQNKENTNLIEKKTKSTGLINALLSAGSKQDTTINEKYTNRFNPLYAISDLISKVPQDDINKSAMKAITNTAVKTITNGKILFTAYDCNITNGCDADKLTESLNKYGITHARVDGVLVFQIHSELKLFEMTGTNDEGALNERNEILKGLMERYISNALYSLKQSKAVEFNLETTFTVINPYNNEKTKITSLIVTMDELTQIMQVLNSRYKAYLLDSNKILIEEAIA